MRRGAVDLCGLTVEFGGKIVEFGVGDGVRTRDIRCHRPTLYQLSYAHHQ